VGRQAVYFPADRLTRAVARGPTGLTLVELVLGLSITMVLGAAIAAMLFAVYDGTSAQIESRGLAVSHVTAAARISAAARASRDVLAAGENYLVLWNAEVRSDGVPNLSELQRIERDPASGELRSYQAPLDLPDAENTAYGLETTDFNAVTASLRGTKNFPGKLWATDVSSLTVSLIPDAARKATFVSFRIATTADGADRTTVGGAALRNKR